MPIVGQQQYGYYSSNGSDWSSFGRVSGGDRTMDPNVQARDGIGALSTNVGGSGQLIQSVTFQPQVSTFFTTSANILRASTTTPALNSLYVEGGSTADNSAWQISGAKVNSCSLTCDIDSALTADIEFMGTAETTGSARTVSESSNTFYEWFSGVVTVDGSALLTQSMSIDISNNLIPYWSLDTKANHKRLPDGFSIGAQEVTLSCDVLTHPGTSAIEDWILADAIDKAIAGSFAFTNSGDTITIAFTALSCTGISHPFTVDGQVVYSMSFVSQKNAGITISAA